MLVSNIFRQKGDQVITVRPEATIAEATDILKQEHIGALIVMGDDGALAGILSERDIVRAMPGHGRETVELRVEQLMTRTVVTCSPGDHVHEIMKMMTDGPFRHLPVVSEGKILGIISIGDVVKSRLDELEFETSQMRDFISQ